MKTFLKLVAVFLFLLVIVAGYLFVQMNPQPTDLWLVTTLQPRPAGQWLLLFFLVGCIGGLLTGLGLYRQFRNRLKVRALELKLRKLTDENNRLRNIAVKDVPER